jgi:CHASE2 domain-containing sensor protein
VAALSGGVRLGRVAVVLLLAGVLAATVGLLAREVDGPVERLTVDARFGVRGPQAPSPRIVIVAYDNRTLRALAVRPPVPRQIQARVVDALDRAGARAVAFDYSLEQASGDPAQDRRLAVALMNARAAIVSVTAPERDGRVADLAGFIPFADIEVRPGYTPLQLDGQGTVRTFRVPPRGLETFALAAVASATDARHPPKVPAGALIDYPGPTGTVPALSYVDVLRGRFPSAAVAGRIVIIGSTATVIGDTHRVPVDGTMPGAEIHAAEMATALRGFPLRQMADTPARLLIVLLGLSVPALVLLGAGIERARRDGRGAPLGAPGVGSVVLAAAGVTVAWLVAAQLAFDAGTVVEIVPGIIAIAISVAAVVVVVHRLSVQARRSLRRRFADRDPSVVGQVLGAGRRRRRTLGPGDIIPGFTMTGPGLAGGMGVVYPAQQKRLARPVMIKLIRGDRSLDPAYRRRFVDEAYRAAGLIHPNIVVVHDAGADDRVLYLVMQPIDGHDLRAWLTGGARMEQAAAVQMLHRVACALDHAYVTQGLVHRDVKPANVLIPRDSPRHPYLTDFGVAATDGEAGEAGTAAYRAPRGHGTRSGDVYALAVVLLECVAGRRPGPGAYDGLDPALAAVIARGLADDPDERPPTAAALTRDAARVIGVDVVEDAAPAAAGPGDGAQGEHPKDGDDETELD